MEGGFHVQLAVLQIARLKQLVQCYPRTSSSKLDSELEKLTKIFLENGYPEDVISVYIKEKIGNFSADIKIGPQKCLVYLKLPWIGNSSLSFESQIKQAITNCFFAVNPRVVYSTKMALPSIQKDCVPATQKSSVVYEFTST